MSVFRTVRYAALIAIGALLTLGGSVAAASPGTLRVIEIGSPSLGRSVTVTAPGGGTFRADPGRTLSRITSAPGVVADANAWCVDPTRSIAEGTDYQVDLQTTEGTPELATPRYRELAWLIGAADGLIATAPNARSEAAAVQVGVWQLVGHAADLRAVTTDSALNERVAALRALAAGRAPVTALAISGPASALAPGEGAVLTVTGTPGAAVDLAVSGGSATLSAARVTLDHLGTAQVTVTTRVAGSVVVEGVAQGGALVRAVHAAGRPAQNMAFVTPRTLRARTTISAVAPVTTPPLSTPAVVPIASVPTRSIMRLAKSAPARIRPGRRLAYTLTVTNLSTVTATGVVLRDPLPGGTFAGRLPTGARLVSGAVVWRLGSIAPGARVTVHLFLRTLPTATGDVVNVASASASNADTVRARALTHLRRPSRVAPARIQPAVTG